MSHSKSLKQSCFPISTPHQTFGKLVSQKRVQKSAPSIAHMDATDSLDNIRHQLCVLNLPAHNFRDGGGSRRMWGDNRRHIDLVKGQAGAWPKTKSSHESNSWLQTEIEPREMPIQKGPYRICRSCVYLCRDPARPWEDSRCERYACSTEYLWTSNLSWFYSIPWKILPNLSEVSAPLRLLPEKDILFHWVKPQKDSFQNLKHLVRNTPVLRYYDPKKPLSLTVDASSKSLGAALVQEGQPIAYGTRALTKSQQNYAQIEKEALAISYGCTKCPQYVFGRHVLVASDHKPLRQSIDAELPFWKSLIPFYNKEEQIRTNSFDNRLSITVNKLRLCLINSHYYSSYLVFKDIFFVGFPFYV